MRSIYRDGLCSLGSLSARGALGRRRAAGVETVSSRAHAEQRRGPRTGGGTAGGRGAAGVERRGRLRAGCNVYSESSCIRLYLC
eukprot:226215-Prymnesium_polylepis.1